MVSIFRRIWNILENHSLWNFNWRLVSVLPNSFGSVSFMVHKVCTFPLLLRCSSFQLWNLFIFRQLCNSLQICLLSSVLLLVTINTIQLSYPIEDLNLLYSVYWWNPSIGSLEPKERRIRGHSARLLKPQVQTNWISGILCGPGLIIFLDCPLSDERGRGWNISLCGTLLRFGTQEWDHFNCAAVQG